LQLHPHKELGKLEKKEKQKKEGKLTNTWDADKALVTLSILCKTSKGLIK